MLNWTWRFYALKVLSSFHQCPVLKTRTSDPTHLFACQLNSSTLTVILTYSGEFSGGRPTTTRNGVLWYSTVRFCSGNRIERKPLCLLIGFPFTSYISDVLDTACESLHKRDSHWFLPMESPTNTILPFRLLSRKSLALNLWSFHIK